MIKKYYKFINESNSEQELLLDLKDLCSDLIDEQFDVSVINLADKFHSPKFLIKIKSELNLAYDGKDHNGNEVGIESLQNSIDKNKKMFDISIELCKRMESTRNWKISTFLPSYGGPSGRIFSVINIYATPL